MGQLEADEVDQTTESQASRWAFWKKTVIGDGRTAYLTRLSIIITPWFSIKLHRIHRPDNQRELHSHPWSFFSLILKGHYLEDTVSGPRRRFWWNWKPWKGPKSWHSIREVVDPPVWTLVFTGPRRQVWGFWTERGFVPWNEYEKLNTP